MDEQEKNNGAKTTPQKGQRESFFTTEEKAQYEVFRNGNLPRETIEKWIRNDLSAVLSFVHGILNDEEIFTVLVDKYYEKYKKLHENSPSDVEEIIN